MTNGIFLAHINEDKPKVRILRDRLRAEGFRTWMDEDNIHAGQDWEKHIEKVIPDCGLFILCLSKTSSSKWGVYQKEKKLAEQVQMYVPDDGIFIIPVFLEDEAEIKYEKLQSVRFVEESCLQKLIQSIRELTNEIQKRKAFMTDVEYMCYQKDFRAQYRADELDNMEELKAEISVADKDTHEISKKLSV